MNILICDDELCFLNDLETHVSEYMKNHYIHCCIFSTTSPLTALENERIYDLAFLDIQMDGMDGITLAKELRKRNSKAAIFFVTSFNEYQDDAMDVNAFRFFEKPFDKERLYRSLDKAMEYIDEAYVDVFVQNNSSQKRIAVDDIRYLTRENRRVVMKTAAEKLVINGDFDDWCEMLPSTFFYRVHKSFFVNLHHVDVYKYTELFLTDGTRIPISTRKQSDFHKYWFNYLRRR